MNDFNGSITRPAKVTEALLWLAAGLVTVGVHAGAVAWLLRGEVVVAADNSPPAAIMIEFAAVPEAIQATRDEITPDQKSAEESVPRKEQRGEERPPEQTAEPATRPEQPAEHQEIKEKTAVLDRAEVQLPTEQPKPKQKQRQETKKQKPKENKPPLRKQQAAAESKVAWQAHVEARQSHRIAAAQTASGLSSTSPANWQSLLMAHLERRKRYPSGARERGARGIAYVRFTIDGAGKVLSASLVRSSGFAELDQEVVALVHRASPVPAPPPGASRTITVPVNFDVN
ncbi:energy transducer TonB family protein [Bradyrhizobium cenepequi]|uniref:energy transducer TonB family protein n=1 Tax=Bradyrhizobium cenepequi TaxID=2821403 RepID=UPI001CE24CF0|nr:energy transducer TonB [Bradyrhizobium cenepequi]MCA6110816.1 energy transducer TonB [Bradyrhizobium cenepequi]